MSRNRRPASTNIITASLMLLAVAFGPSSPVAFASATQAAPLVAQAETAAKKKVVVFWADYGNGHKAAAQAIKEQINRANPGVEVVMKTLNDFLSPAEDKISTYLFEATTRHLPGVYDLGYNAYMEVGRRLKSVGDMPSVSKRTAMKILAFLEKEKPDAIIGTHFGTVEYMTYLRNKGLISRNIPLAWQHTDFADEEYWAHLVKDMNGPLDHVFVPHQSLKDKWVEKYGVPEERLQVTGIPVKAIANVKLTEQEQRDFLISKGLDPARKTITIMSGGNGVGNYPKMAGSISKGLEGSNHQVQLVAVCGKNPDCFESMMHFKLESESGFRAAALEAEKWLEFSSGGRLNMALKHDFYRLRNITGYSKEAVEALMAKLSKVLPESKVKTVRNRLMAALPQMTVKVEAFVSGADPMNYLKSSTLFIGKAGGITTSEITRVGKDAVLLNINGGQEVANGRMFEKNDLGWWTNDQGKVGEITRNVLDHPEISVRHVANQREFIKGYGEAIPSAVESRHGEWVVNTLEKTQPSHWDRLATSVTKCISDGLAIR